MNYTLTKISCYIGYFVQALIINFLPLLFVTLNTDYGISLSLLATLSVITFVVQLLTDLISPSIINKIGMRGGAVAANFFAFLGLLLLGILPNLIGNIYLAVLLSVIVYSVGGGLIEVIISPIIEYLPTRNKAAQMSLLHSFYCFGQLLTVAISTLIFFLFSVRNWQYLSIAWSAIPLINMFLVINVPIVEIETEKAIETDRKTLKTPFFYIFLTLMLSAGASEIAVSQWSSTFAEITLGLNKSLGDLLCPTLFALFMGIGRLLYGIYGERMKIEKVMLYCSVLCLISYLLLALPLPTLFKILGILLCGLSVSVMWPGTISLTAKRFKNSGAKIFSFLAAAGDIGCSVGPFIIGIAAERIGLSPAFFFGLAFPLILIIALQKVSIEK